MLLRQRAVIALATYLLLLTLHLAVRLAGEATWATRSQWVLMPALALVLLASPVPRTRLWRWTLAGVGFSWLGDLLPDLVPSAAAFPVLIASFAVAQGCFAAGFWPFRGGSVAGRPVMYAYLAVAVVLVLVCAPGSGPLLAPVVVYAALITVMAILATGVHPLTGVGAVVFLASDSLIALNAFVASWELPHQGFWVMLTYGIAELLIVLGVLARGRSAARDSLGP